MNTISCSKVFLVLLVTLLPNQIFAYRNLISSACAFTQYKELCKNTVESDTEGSSATSFSVVSKVALNHATSTATEIHNQVTTLLKGSSSNIKTALTDCDKNYQDAIERLGESSKALASKNYFDVYTWVSSAMTSSDTCDDGFNDVGVKSPLGDKVTTFTQLCSIVIDITDHLK